MTDRRRFIAVCALGALAPACAPSQASTRRVGYLTPTSVPAATNALIAALQELGYVESRTLKVESLSAEDDLGRLPRLAKTLVDSRVDVIVAASPPAIRAASGATRTIPIVMGYWGGEGLVESGIIAGFAHPGTNVTGVYMLAAELDAKRLSLLLEAIPSAKKVALLNPGVDWGSFAEIRRVAQSASIQLYMSDQPDVSGYESTFDAMEKQHVDALLVPPFPRFFRERRQIIEMAAQRRIPAMYDWGQTARDGGLIAYGPVPIELTRRVAAYVDRILRGANPADLPVEQPNKFELVINRRTAMAMGLTIPGSVLQRTDEIVD